MKTKTKIVLRTFVFAGMMIAVQLLAAKMPVLGMMFNTLATIFWGTRFFIYLIRKINEV